MLTDQERAARRLTLELTSRNGFIFLHAALGVEVGLAMLIGGGPTYLESTPDGPEWRLGLAALSVIAGLIGMAGVWIGARRPLGWGMQVIGLSGICIWELILVVVFAVGAIKIGVEFPRIGQHVDPNAGRMFSPFVYLTLAILLMNHLSILFRIRKK